VTLCVARGYDGLVTLNVTEGGILCVGQDYSGLVMTRNGQLMHLDFLLPQLRQATMYKHILT